MSFENDAVHAYGRVVNVKSIPSRQVTRIEIEIPVEAHREVTSLLFDRDVVVLPWDHVKTKVPYGIRTLSDYTKAAAPRPAPKTIPAPSSMFGSVAPKRERDYVAEAAIACKSAEFWQVLTTETGAIIRTEQDAASTLRAALGIASRSELRDNPAAQSEFLRLVAAADNVHPMREALSHHE